MQGKQHEVNTDIGGLRRSLAGSGAGIVPVEFSASVGS